MNMYSLLKCMHRLSFKSKCQKLEISRLRKLGYNLRIETKWQKLLSWNVNHFLSDILFQLCRKNCPYVSNSSPFLSQVKFIAKWFWQGLALRLSADCHDILVYFGGSIMSLKLWTLQLRPEDFVFLPNLSFIPLCKINKFLVVLLKFIKKLDLHTNFNMQNARVKHF